jgi:hypothetical protein
MISLVLDPRMTGTSLCLVGVGLARVRELSVIVLPPESSEYGSIIFSHQSTLFKLSSSRAATYGEFGSQYQHHKYHKHLHRIFTGLSQQ